MFRTFTLLIATAMLSACAAALVGGAAVGGAAHDRRSFGTVLDDNAIQLGAYDNLNKDKDLAIKSNVEIVVYNGVVLLIGEVPSEELKARAETKVREIQGVQRVVNELRIMPSPNVYSATRDKWITARVKTALLDIVDLPGFDPTRVNVTTQASVVYLLGIVTPVEAERVIEIARTVPGVLRVVKVLEDQEAPPAKAEAETKTETGAETQPLAD